MDAEQALEIQRLQEENEKAAAKIEQQENERLQYKTRCTEKPPADLVNDPKKLCDLWKWQLQRNKDCASMRRAFSEKWYGGPDAGHSKAIDENEMSIKNLTEKIKRLCDPCSDPTGTQ
ncbi:MAG TPA: hypothetical protein VF607_07995 [Verrucomicrobiae bacterium]